MLSSFLSFLFFLLLMHLRVIYYELYCLCQESERLPGSNPNLFAKMINLAHQTERFPHPLGFITFVCWVNKPDSVCPGSEVKGKPSHRHNQVDPHTMVRHEASLLVHEPAKRTRVIIRWSQTGFNYETTDRNTLQVLLKMICFSLVMAGK